MSSSVDIDNKKKDMLILGLGPNQGSGLDDTTITAEAQYSINFARSNRKFCLSLHYNGNINGFINATKIYQFKAKDSVIKKYRLCLGNILGNLSANKMKKKTELNGCVYNFSVDYKTFDTSNIIDIHKYLMKRNNVK